MTKHVLIYVHSLHQNKDIISESFLINFIRSHLFYSQPPFWPTTGGKINTDLFKPFSVVINQI